MSTRLIELCLIAYPRAVRAADREHLRGLAIDLAEDHGAVREALGLLRGGLAERWRRRGRPVGWAMVGSAVAAVVLVGLTWAAAQGGRVEVEVLTCMGVCAEAQAEVASLVRTGWTCSELDEPAGPGWRCTGH